MNIHTEISTVDEKPFREMLVITLKVPVVRSLLESINRLDEQNKRIRSYKI